MKYEYKLFLHDLEIQNQMDPLDIFKFYYNIWMKSLCLEYGYLIYRNILTKHSMCSLWRGEDMEKST